MQESAKPKQEGSAGDNIKNVWAYNAEKEFLRVHSLLEQGFTYVAMDTEFPGFLYDCGGNEINSEMIYGVVKRNVDELRPIQVGLTFSDLKGNKPEGPHTLQFNICFNKNAERHSAESINLLTEAGINFNDMAEHGIDYHVFGDLLMTSGLVVNQSVQWITFHGCYDFAYLIKVLRNEALPQSLTEFKNYLQHLFPNIWDVKVLINDFQEWKNDSLSKLASRLDLKRSGNTHQAGSDALLTSNVFFKIMQLKYPNGFPEVACNKVFGLSFGIASAAPTTYIDQTMTPYYNYSQGYGYPGFEGYFSAPYYPHSLGHEYYFPSHPVMPQMSSSKFVSPFPGATQSKDLKKK